MQVGEGGGGEPTLINPGSFSCKCQALWKQLLGSAYVTVIFTSKDILQSRLDGWEESEWHKEMAAVWAPISGGSWS